MNLRDWLARREPSPPRVLRERVEALALAVPEGEGNPADTLLEAAEAALAGLATRPSDDRSTALDLLTVDALVTYALEWTAEHPDDLPQLSERAMTCLSRVAVR